MTSKYEVDGSQTAYQPGSDGRVLANRLGIADQTELEDAELRLLGQLYEAVLNESFPERQLTFDDLALWHRRWLGNLYGWAGHQRSVNMSKGGFHFAAAAQVPALLIKFEQDYLARFTPCFGMDHRTLISAIATIHVEFILIHPFREGNGRLSRLLADVMATQAGRGPLDYSLWNTRKNEYFAAIQEGLDCNYAPMARFVEAALAPQ